METRDSLTKPITEIFNIVNERTRRQVEDPVAKVLREGMVVGLANHTILIRKDRTEIPIDDSGAPITEEDGTITGVVLVFRDITDRKRMEDALRESEERFRLALQNAPVTVAVQDRNLVYRWAYNQQSRQPDDIIGKTDADLFPDDVTWLLELKRGVLKTGTDVHAEKWLTSNGTRMFLDLHYTPLRDSSGEITGIGMATVNLTKQKIAEEALRENETRLRRFYESGLLGVIYWNMDGAIIDANDKFLEMVGYTREDLAAGSIDWLHMTPAEYRHLDEQSMAESKATGVNKAPFEKEYIRKDGTRIPTSWRGR